MRAVLSFVLAVSVMFWSWPHSVEAQAACRFALGFETMRNLVGADKVGNCLEDERINAENGNTEQRTTGGLLVWRNSDGFTSFTDGSTTWVNGPVGLQSRPNNHRFFWEEELVQAPSQQSPLTSSSTPALAPSSPAPGSTQQAAPARQSSIDPRLMPAWRTLTSTVIPDSNLELGQAFAQMVSRSGVSLQVGNLPRSVNGVYSRTSNSIIVSDIVVRDESTYVVAALLAHEVSHAQQYTSGIFDWDKNCIEMEVSAYTMQALVWGTFVLGFRQWPDRTALERVAPGMMVLSS